MSTEAQFIFEDDQGGQRDETRAELMKVDQYAPQIKILTTLGQYLQYQVDHQQASDEINEESSIQRREKNKKKKAYTLYSHIDKFNFIHHMIVKCLKTIALVARLYNINPRKDQRWWAKGYVKKLNIEHKDFLVELFDKGPAATIEDAIEELSANFEGIEIGSTTVHDFLKIDMNFTFRRATFHAE
ncbi:uncharacterized protein B0P05DRAFT_593312 [Gilbertella persicaria]|uniref:uncharacterized protein n=1 Tax=Gilbertella persicaria TaxID=101096 RepID=UPI00221F5BBB|nr:uncharacterized protein B0P05DRAFT_593312 [Gilbertella persicaria]KAI8097905.1 hypothetical protein B0P05DRAFT_593312 [Gilbertella persicaria]